MFLVFSYWLLVDWGFKDCCTLTYILKSGLGHAIPSHILKSGVGHAIPSHILSLEDGTLNIYDSASPRLTVNEIVHNGGEARAYSVIGDPDEISKFFKGMESLN